MLYGVRCGEPRREHRMFKFKSFILCSNKPFEMMIHSINPNTHIQTRPSYVQEISMTNHKSTYLNQI